MSEMRFIGSRFKVEELIGQGGMGAVYRGRDVSTSEQVAIKALKDEIMGSDPDIVERFQREADALRKLNHPNIVKMLALVEEDGQRYLVMEYVAGGSLSDLLRKQPQLEIERALEIALDLADALTRTHRLNIIHRDIKPQNVLVAEDGTPRLTDFGVARVEERTRMTETGILVGTYAYLSPEACNGEKVDEKTDIWAFGVMLYQMLAGRRPFESESVTGLLLSIIRDPHPDIRTLRPDVPDKLAHLLDLMLVKDANERIDSIRQVGAELETLLREARTGEVRPSRLKPLNLEESRFATPSHQPSISPVQREAGSMTRWLQQQETTSLDSPHLPPNPRGASSRRLPLLLMVFGVVLLGLLGSVFGFANSGQEESLNSERVDPVAENEIMILVAEFEPLDNPTVSNPTRFVAEDLTSSLEGLPFSSLRLRVYPRVLEASQIQTVAEQTQAMVIIWGTYSDAEIVANVSVGDIEQLPYNLFERTLLENTLNIRVRLTNARQQTLAPHILGMVSMLYAADGDLYENPRYLLLLENIQQPSGEILLNTEAAFLHRYLQVFFVDSEQALTNIERALEINQGNPLLQIAPVPLYLRLEDLERAQRVNETARRLGPSDWVSPLSLDGNLKLLSGDLEGAIAVYDEIVRLRPDDWFVYNYRAAIYYQMGDYEAAKADYEQAFALEPTADFPYPYSMLLALRDGRLNDARDYVNIILTQYKDPTLSKKMIFAVGLQNQNVFGWVFSAFGNLLSAQYEAALLDLEGAIAVNDQSADYYFMQGFAYCNLGEDEAAETAYTRAIELDPEFELLYILRAEVREKRGNLAGALEDLSQAQALGLNDELADLVANRDTLSCQNFLGTN